MTRRPRWLCTPGYRAVALACLTQVACGASAGVAVNDHSAVIEPVELPGGKPGIGFDDLQWSAALGRVIVPGGRTGSVFLIDPDSLQVSALSGFSKSDSYDGDHDFGVTSAVEAEGSIYAIDRTSKQLVQVDPRDAQRKATLGLRASPDYVRFVEETRELWVTEPDAGQIEVIALGGPPPSALKSTALIAVQRGPESLVIDHVHARAYTNSFTGSTFSIDLRTHAILDRSDNGCLLSLGIAFDETKQRVFVACYGGQVSAFAAGSDHLLGREDLSRGVDIIAFDPVRQRLHVASSKRSELSLVRVADDGTLRAERTVPTGGSGSCVTVDGAGRSWLCDPSHGRVLRVTWAAPAQRTQPP
jgi:streptogramin lyase